MQDQDKTDNSQPHNIKDVLESLGYRLIDRGDHWRTSAIYRGGSNPNSISIFKGSGVWSDFGAGVSARPIEDLIKLSSDKFSNIKLDKTACVDSEDNDVERIYPNSILDKLMPHYKFYEDKGINVKFLKRLKSGMAMSGKMYQRYVFPIFDKDSRIIGFSGRDMLERDKDTRRPKWKHIGKKNKWIYPIYVPTEGPNFAVEAIRETKKAYIVESIGDLIAMHNFGVENVIVNFGVSISTDLICFLISLDVEMVYLCYNNDYQKEINTGLNSAIRDYLKILPYLDYDNIGIVLPVKKDFGAMNTLDFEKWLKKRDTINFVAQREVVCQKAPELVEKKLLTKEIYKNIRYLDCG